MQPKTPEHMPVGKIFSDEYESPGVIGVQEDDGEYGIPHFTPFVGDTVCLKNFNY